jgi:hypothetical protein
MMDAKKQRGMDLERGRWLQRFGSDSKTRLKFLKTQKALHNSNSKRYCTDDAVRSTYRVGTVTYNVIK